MDELERSLLVAYRYLVAAFCSGKPASWVLEEAQQVRIYQGELWLDGRPFAFDWVLTDEGHQVTGAPFPTPRLQPWPFPGRRFFARRPERECCG